MTRPDRRPPESRVPRRPRMDGSDSTIPGAGLKSVARGKGGVYFSVANEIEKPCKVQCAVEQTV